MSEAIESVPAHTWTPAIKTRFLDRLAVHGNARAACRAVGFSPEAAYRLRRRDAAFARGWAAALVLARENCAQVLAERAIEGVEEEIWYRGELLGTRRRYDARLLLAHLARLDRLADDETASPDAARFDELLACIAGEKPPGDVEDWDGVLPPARDAHAEFAAEVAHASVADSWSADSGRPVRPDTLSKARRAQFTAECTVAAAEAREVANTEWDAWSLRACSAVDAFVSPRRAATLLPGLGSDQPVRSAGSGRAGEGLRLFSRTASYASTTALALSLAGVGDRQAGWGALPPRGRAALRHQASERTRRATG